MRWKVGEIERVQYSSATTWGFSFSVQTTNGAPMLTLSYASEAEAKQAHEAMRKVIEHAAEITAP